MHEATEPQQHKRSAGRRCRQLRDSFIRARPLPLGPGIAFAAIVIGVEALVVYWFRHMGSPMSFRAIFMLGVLLVSAGWDFGLSVATTIVSGLVYFYFHLDHEGTITVDDFVALAVFLPIAFVANVLGRQARLRATESEQRRQEADAAAALAGDRK